MRRLYIAAFDSFMRNWPYLLLGIVIGQLLV